MFNKYEDQPKPGARTGEIKDRDYATIGAMLYTRDGRKTNNAVVLEVIEMKPEHRVIVCTATGGVTSLPVSALPSLYYEPQWKVDTKAHLFIELKRAREKPPAQKNASPRKQEAVVDLKPGSGPRYVTPSFTIGGTTVSSLFSVIFEEYRGKIESVPKQTQFGLRLFSSETAAEAAKEYARLRGAELQRFYSTTHSASTDELELWHDGILGRVTIRKFPAQHDDKKVEPNG
jgi:hypothetical protein